MKAYTKSCGNQPGLKPQSRFSRTAETEKRQRKGLSYGRISFSRYIIRSRRRKKWSGNLRAEITVFFALISAITAAMLLLILESARTQGSRLYMTVAANSSIDSLFSQYHRKLWEEYRLLGLEHYAYDQLTDEMTDFINPYFRADNWYPMETEEISIEDLRLITDDNAEYYEAEVLDYMRYGIAASVISLAEADLFSGSIRDGTAVNGMSDIYEGHAREAMRLEAAIEDIGDNLKELGEHRQRAEACLRAYSGRAFISEARQMQKNLKRLPGLIEVYERRADRMAEGLAESRRRLDSERESGDLSDSSWEALNSDAAEYESYVSEDGERRKEITGFADRAERGIDFLDGVISEAEEVMEYISDWEPEDEDDELDEESLWAPVISHFASFDLISLESRYGIQDKEKEQQLESVKTLLSGELLKLVLPQGAVIGNESYELGEKPSETCMNRENVVSASITDRLYLAEYAIQLMDYFGRGSFDAGSTITGSGHEEIEYILFGKENDTENLEAAVRRLVEIRTGLNLVYLYSDADRRNEARTLALSITGAFGLTPLVTVACFMIMSIWSLGQAVCDVRTLLGGGRVPLMHDSETFNLSLSGLLELAGGSMSSTADSGSGKGLKYKDYLRMLLFFTQNTEQDYRCMDIMQMNIRRLQSDFLMSRLAYSLEASVSTKAGHVFSMLGLVKAHGIDTGSSYTMKVSTAYSY